MNALVIETAFLGDAVVSLTLARELKRTRPDAKLTYLVRPDAAALVELSPDVDEVMIFDKRGADRGLAGIEKLVTTILDRSFDTLFLLHGSKRSQLLARKLTTIAKRIGFDSARSAALTHTVSEVDSGSRYARSASLLSAIGIEISSSPLPRLRAEPAIAAFESEYVAIAPGSVWATKRWPAANFARLVGTFVDAGIAVALIGGPSDQLICEEIASAYTHTGLVKSFAGRIDIAASVAIIESARLLVSNDSAPMHIAVAVATPVVAIFGPTVKEFGFAPPAETGTVIEVDLWCRPCTSHGAETCPLYHHNCMALIRPEEVFSKAMEYSLLAPTV